jgi:formate hydrogenlyase transcriptional activator
MILCPGHVLHVDPPLRHDAHLETGGAPTDALEDVERRHILRVLAESSWRIKRVGSASRRLRMNPSTLRSRMKKLDIVCL